MKDFKNSQTYQNLIHAFGIESQAYAKYQFYAKQAKKDKYNVLANFFNKIALQEKQHAKIWFKKLHHDEIPVTLENIKNCIENESYEARQYYLEHAKTAKLEGYEEIARLFSLVAQVEQSHHDQLTAFFKELTDDTMYSSKQSIIWICSECGHVHKGKNPPAICPICAHPSQYFEKYFKA